MGAEQREYKLNRNTNKNIFTEKTKNPKQRNITKNTKNGGTMNTKT